MKTIKLIAIIIFIALFNKVSAIPTLSIGSPSPSIAKSSTLVSFTITYTGATTVNLNSSYITINHTGTSGGTINILNGTTFAPVVEISGVIGDGSYTISISGGSSTDGTLDVGAGPSGSVTVDNTPPTASITYNDADGYVKQGQVLRITATFDENMGGAPAPKIALSGAATLSATDMTFTDATHYYYDYTVPAGNGTQTVALSVGTDLAGNVITSSPTSGATFEIDNTAPTAAITYDDADGRVKQGQILKITATFNESMSGSPAPKIALSGVANLSATSMTFTDATHYFYNYTVPAGNGTQTVALSVGTDLAGNVVTSGPTSGSTFFIDNTAPTISSINFLTPATSPTNATSIVYRVTFTENVKGVTTGAFSLTTTGTASGTIASVSSSSGNVIDVTINSVIGDGTLRLNLSTSTGISDDADNNLSTTRNGDQTYTIDNIAPSVTTINMVATTPTNSSTVDFLVTFDESVIGVSTSNFAVSGTATAASVSSISGSGTTRTLTVTTGGVDGSLGLDLSSITGITDNAGNALSSTHLSDQTYTIDKTAPTASITYDDADGNVNQSQTLKITATFSESMVGSPVPKIALGGAVPLSATNMTITDATHYFYNYNVPAGNGIQTVALSVGTDLAGNVITSAPTSGSTFVIDNTAPSVSSINYQTPASSPTNATSLIYRVTFSEYVKGVTTGAFSLTATGTASGSIASVSSSSGTTIDVTINSVTGNGTLRLNLSTVAGISDAADNALSATHNGDQTYTIDNIAPSASSINYQTPASSPTNETSLVYRITFSESVNGVDITDFTLTPTGTVSGSITSVSSGSGTTIDVTVSTVSGEGTLRLDLNSGGTGIVDNAGNAISGGFNTGQTYTIDNVAPSVSSINRVTSTPTNSSSVDFLVTFSESVSNVLTTNFSLSGTATAASIFSISGSGATRTVTVTTGGVDGTLQLNLTTTAGITDLAGNALSATHTGDQIYTIDKTTLTPTLTEPATGGADDPSVLIDFTLPENAQAGTVKMTFTNTSGSNDNHDPHIITFNSNFEGAGDHTTSLNGADLSNNTNVTSVSSNTNDYLLDGAYYSVKIEYKDLLGNAVSSVTNTNFFYESNSPTATVVPVAPDPRNANAGIVNINFSRGVRVLTVNISDFTLTLNGIGVDISSCPLTYTGSYTGGSYTLATNFRVDLSSVTTAEGTYVFTIVGATTGILTQGGSLFMVDASDTWLMDTTNPTVIISTTATSPTKTSPIPFTAQFSEIVSNFISSDITVGNGSVTGFTPVDGDTYDFTVTPAANGTVTIDILAGVCQDAATNNNNVAIQKSIDFDNIAPTLSSVHIQSDNTNNTAYAKDGNVVSLTFTASEPIQNVGVTIDGIAATSITGGPTVWTASRTLSGATQGQIPFNISFEDIAQNAGTSVVNTTDASKVTFFNTAPTLSSVTIVSDYASHTDKAKTGSVVTISFASVRELANVIATIAGHSATISHSDNYNWTASYTMQNTDNEGIIPFTIDFTDMPENAGTRVTAVTSGSNVTFDKTTPELNAVTIASNNTHPEVVGAGGVVTVTITGSENIDITGATIAGKVATLAGSAKNWTASYTMQSGDPASVNFSISFKDYAGNIGTAVSTTTNGSSVAFDEVKPTLTAVAIISNNSVNTAKATLGDVVTITFTADDNVEGVVTKINSKNTVVTSLGGLNWKAEYTMSTSDVTEGVLPFTIDFKDYAGNIGTQVISTTNSSSVTYDKTKPTLTGVTISSDYSTITRAHTGSIVTVTITASESLSSLNGTIDGKSAVAAGAGTSWTLSRTTDGTETEGILGIVINYTDLAGNAGNPVTSITSGSQVIFDKTAPSLLSVSIASDNANTTRAKTGNTVTLTIRSDENLSALSGTIDGKAAVAVGSGTNWTLSRITDGSETEGTLGYSIIFTDLAGNDGVAVNSTTNGSSVTFDKTNPVLTTVTIVSNNVINTAKAKTGNTITVNIVSNENLLSLSGTIDGKVAVASGSGTNWTLIRLTDGSENDGILGFSISFTDLTGNAGTNVSATTNSSIVTFDKIVPTIGSVSIVSNNPNTAKAKDGDIITLTFTSSETITPTVTFEGNTATSTSSVGNSWTATYNLTGNLNKDIAFSISFVDLTGNVGTTQTATNDGSKVTIDNNTPSLSNITIASNNANASLAKVGNLITLHFTSSEAINTPTVTIDGNAAVASIISGNNWKAEYTLTTSDAEGNLPFSINFGDIAGNIGGAITATTNGSSVTFDRTNPSLTFVGFTSNNTINTALAKTGNTVTLTITSSENLLSLSGTIDGKPAVASGSGANWTLSRVTNGTETDGILGFSIDFSDLSGNAVVGISATTNSSSVTFDKIIPTISAISIVSNNVDPIRAKNGDIITLTFTSSETITPTVTFEGNAPTSLSNVVNAWTATYNLTGNLNKDLAFSIAFVDLTGNAGTTATSTSDASKVTVDNTPPTLSSVHVLSNNANNTLAKAGDLVTLQFTASESIQSPAVTINGLAATTITGGPAVWTASRTIGASETQGLVVFSIPIIDLTGNSGTTGTITTDASRVTVDRQLPVISSVTVPSGVYKVGSIIPITITTDDLIYTAQTLTVNGKNQVLINKNDNTYLVNYTVVEGDNDLPANATLPVSIVLVDYSGNTNVAVTAANSVSGNITIDAHTPQITSVTSDAEVAGNLKIGDQLVFTLTPVVAESGLTILPSTYNSKPLVWSTSNGGNTYTATYTVQDGDANQETALQLGNVTLSDVAGNVSTILPYNSIVKKIYGAKPTVRITGTIARCDYPTPTVPITFTFVGKKPYTFTYNDGTGNQTMTALNADSYVVNVLKGTYTLVSLVDATGNISTSALENATVTVNNLPTIDFTVSSLTFNKNDAAVNLMNYVQLGSIGGNFTGEGVTTTNYFYPSLFGVQNTPITRLITYTLTNSNGCINTRTISITVTSDLGYFSGIDPNYCKNDWSPTSVSISVLNVHNYAGLNPVFTLTPNSNKASTQDWNHYIINPKEMKAGSYALKYEYTDSLTNNRYPILQSFEIDSVGKAIDFQVVGGTPLETKYCKNDTTVLLEAIEYYPSNGKGHFSGPGLGFSSDNGSLRASFKPQDAALGQNAISFYFSTNAVLPQVGCSSDTIIKVVNINSLPTLSFPLNDNYNFDGKPVTLVGDPLGGNFSSAEIVRNNSIFPKYASLSNIGQPIKITYIYQDPVTGCNNSLSHETKVYRATDTIQNLNATYCYEDKVLDISCSPVVFGNAIPFSGTFSSKKLAITQISGNEAKYSIKDAGAGLDTVRFNYTIGTSHTPYEIVKRVFVDSIGNLRFINLDNKYCKSVESFTFNGTQDHFKGDGTGTSKYLYDGSTSAFTNLVTSANFIPSNEKVGVHTFTYIYKSTYYNSGCTDTVKKQVWINPVPKAKFDLSAACPGTSKDVVFVNQSTFPSDTAMTWTWSIEGKEYHDFAPTYPFKTTGDKSVTLTATTTFEGCSSDVYKRTISIGVDARADFSWDNECLDGTKISFKNTSDGVEDSKIAHSKWIYNGNNIDTTLNTQYIFPGLGEYNMKLAIETKDGCRDTIVKAIVIQPYIKFQELPNLTYYQNFDTINSNFRWQTKGITDAFSSRWNLGKPDGTVIQIDPASDNNSWFTKITDKTNVENSQVVSPCFDFTGLKKPMIKMNIWSSSEPKRDGAVIQYSLDKGNEWTTLGKKGEGIDWFNSDAVLSGPAGQIEQGWSQTPMTNWASARHNLDTLRNQPNVRFRIAYAADGNGISKVDGFAFDDVWIGERKQNILDEYFTNISENSTNNLIKQFETKKNEDIVSVYYHKDDKFYDDYKAGTSSRMFYYGVSQIPYVFANGTVPSTLYNSASQTEFKRLIDVETLKEPSLYLDIKTNRTAGVDVSITALDDLPAASLVLYCAVVKDSIQINSTGDYYYNVLRTFYPNPGGISVSTQSLQKSQTVVRTIPINFATSPELVHSKLVIFVQNSSTNQVYQTITYRVTETTSIDPNSLSNLVDVYPNPASNYLIIDCEYQTEQLAVYDISGRLVKFLQPFQTRYNIPVNDLENGIYIIKGSTKKGEFVKKFIKQ